MQRQIVEDVAGAYPRVSARPTAQALWVTITIQPVQGLPDAAVVSTVYPLDPWRRVSSWAWWTAGVWLGPRHTNYPDGSICSFEVTDGTWTRKDSLLGLLDLTAVWITRHLYLRYFGRWPGRQVLHTAFERLKEHRPEELCGCDSGAKYSDCCQARDLRQTPLDRYREFRRVFPATIRRPSEALIEWLIDPEAPAPRLDDVAPVMPARYLPPLGQGHVSQSPPWRVASTDRL